VDVDGAAQVVAEVLVDLLAVVPRQNDACEPGAVGREHLLLDAADREYVAGEGELAGHGEVAAYCAPGDRRDQRRGDGDPGRGPVDRPDVGLQVDMEVGAAREVRVEAVAAGVGAEPRQRGARRLLHDLPLAAGEGERAGAWHPGCFDEERRAAAARRVAQSDGDARLRGAPGDLGGCRRPEHRGQGVRRHRDRRRGALGPAAHHLGAHRAQHRAQPPHTGLARVAADQRPDRLVGHLHLAGAQPMQRHLPRQQVRGRDLLLLGLGVPGHLDHRDPLPQPRRHRTEAGGGRHEERLGQVERQVQVAVPEGGAGGRVERVEQRRRRPARLVETVDLVEDDERIPRADAAQLVDDAPRRARAGAAQRRRVRQPAARDPRARSPERVGDQRRQRRLADPGRAQQAQQRGRGVRVRQAHRHVVDQPLLDLLVRRMARVEDRAGAFQVERRRSGAPRPGHAQQALEVLARAGMVGVGRRPCRQPREDLVSPLPHGGRQRRRRELFAQTREAVAVAGARRTEKRPHLPRGDPVAHARGVAGLEAQRHLAADRLQAAGQLSHPGLAGVITDDPPAGPRREPHRRGPEAGRPVLHLDQVRLGDGDLLGLRVGGQVDDLEPVPQGRQDPRRLVRRRDEEHLGQVERQLDESVAEPVVLRRVEHLEQDRGRAGAHLVDLVEEDDGVPRADPPHLAQQPPRLRVPPGPVVAAQVRLVPQPAAGEPDEPAPERFTHAVGQRGLADSRRPGEAEHGRAARVAPPHGQVLEEAPLGVGEPGVPGIERRAHLRQVDRRLGAPGPRQLLEPLDPVGARRRVGARGVPQAPALARDGLAHRRRQRVVDLSFAQHLAHHRRRDHRRFPASARRHLPAHRRQLVVQLGHAGLVRVRADQPPHRRALEPDRARARRRPPCFGRVGRRRAGPQLPQLPQRRQVAVQHHRRRIRGGIRRRQRRRLRVRRQNPGHHPPGMVKTPLQQIPLRDVELLLLAVAPQLDHRKPFAHRFGDRAGIGGRRDPHGAAQVELDVEVDIAELCPAGRVQQREHRIDSVGAHLVERFEDKDRVVDPGVAQAIKDATGAAPRHPEDDRRGVGHAQRHTHVRAAERFGDGDPQRCLARPPGAGQARDRGLRQARPHDQRGPLALGSRAPARAFHRQQPVRLPTPGQQLDQPLLDLREPAVAAVERLRDHRGVETLRRARLPRQRQHHRRTPQRRIDGRGVRAKRPPQRPAHLPAHRARQLAIVEVVEHVVDARAGRDQRPQRLEGAVAGRLAPGRRHPVSGLVGRQRVERPRVQQPQRLRLVDHPRTAARGQVRQAPPRALRRRGDHDTPAVDGTVHLRDRAAHAPAARDRAALDGLQRPAVVRLRRRVERQHRAAVRPPQQFRPHLLGNLLTWYPERTATPSPPSSVPPRSVSFPSFLSCFRSDRPAAAGRIPRRSRFVDQESGRARAAPLPAAAGSLLSVAVVATAWPAAARS